MTNMQVTPSVTKDQNNRGTRNVVLVHGAWGDGSNRSKVIPPLEAKGLHVVAVQNPRISSRLRR